MESTLLPCPFCGSLNVQLEAWPDKLLGFAQTCADCHSVGPPDLGITGAQEAWNRRASDKVDEKE